MEIWEQRHTQQGHRSSVPFSVPRSQGPIGCGEDGGFTLKEENSSEGPKLRDGSDFYFKATLETRVPFPSLRES